MQAWLAQGEHEHGRLSYEIFVLEIFLKSFCLEFSVFADDVFCHFFLVRFHFGTYRIVSRTDNLCGKNAGGGFRLCWGHLGQLFELTLQAIKLLTEDERRLLATVGEGIEP